MGSRDASKPLKLEHELWAPVPVAHSERAWREAQVERVWAAQKEALAVAPPSPVRQPSPHTLVDALGEPITADLAAYPVDLDQPGFMDGGGDDSASNRSPSPPPANPPSNANPWMLLSQQTSDSRAASPLPIPNIDPFIDGEARPRRSSAASLASQSRASSHSPSRSHDRRKPPRSATASPSRSKSRSLTGSLSPSRHGSQVTCSRGASQTMASSESLASDTDVDVEEAVPLFQPGSRGHLLTQLQTRGRTGPGGHIPAASTPRPSTTSSGAMGSAPLQSSTSTSSSLSASLTTGILMTPTMSGQSARSGASPHPADLTLHDPKSATSSLGALGDLLPRSDPYTLLDRIKEVPYLIGAALTGSHKKGTSLRPTEEEELDLRLGIQPPTSPCVAAAADTASHVSFELGFEESITFYQGFRAVYPQLAEPPTAEEAQVRLRVTWGTSHEADLQDDTANAQALVRAAARETTGGLYERGATTLAVSGVPPTPNTPSNADKQQTSLTQATSAALASLQLGAPSHASASSRVTDKARLHAASIHNVARLFSELLNERDIVLRESERVSREQVARREELLQIEGLLTELERRRSETSAKLAALADREEKVRNVLLDLEARIGSIGDQTSGFERSVRTMKGDAVVSTTSRSGGPATPGDELSFDRYPDQCIRTLYGHADAIDAIALDMPFGTLVSASRDATLRVWDLSSQTCRALLRNLGQNKAGFTATELSPSAPQILFSGDAKGQILQWDLARLADPLLTSAGSVAAGLKETLPSANWTPSIPAVTPDPEQICTRMFPSDAHTGAITCLMADAETLVSGSDDGTVRVWDAESGKCLLVLDDNEHAGDGHGLRSDGLPLEAMSPSPHLSPGGYLARPPHASRVLSLCFWQNALAVGNDRGQVPLYDTRTGQCHRVLTGHLDGVTQVRFAGNHVVTASKDHTLKVWDLRLASGGLASGFSSASSGSGGSSRGPHGSGAGPGTSTQRPSGSGAGPAPGAAGTSGITTPMAGGASRSRAGSHAGSGLRHGAPGRSGGSSNALVIENLTFAHPVNDFALDPWRLAVAVDHKDLQVVQRASGLFGAPLSGHTKPVSRVKWVGERLVSCGLDQTVKVWRV